MEEQEQLHGFSLPLIPISEEEKKIDLTIERIRDYHYEVGEDFLDYHDSVNIFMFCGFMLNKFPHLNKEILEIANSTYSEINDFKEIDDALFGYCEKEDIDKIYNYYVEFVNLTEVTKARDNQILIQISNHYAK